MTKNRRGGGGSLDPQQTGRTLISERPDPEEGVRLIRALWAIKDGNLRREVDPGFGTSG